MDTKEFIESGALEAYVLGALTTGESGGVLGMIHQYPEVEQELREMESVMQALAWRMAKVPPNSDRSGMPDISLADISCLN